MFGLGTMYRVRGVDLRVMVVNFNYEAGQAALSRTP